MKWMFPDAHDANDNIGTGLGEAYFDKATGKWVFPGQEDGGANDPTAGPPPTGPMMTGIQYNYHLEYKKSTDLT
jgi:hypothetical protein